MATLKNEGLSLEIKYRDFKYGCVHYDICLRWRGEPVINDSILKRHNEYWANRGVGAIKACEDGECGILPLLRRVLETNEADYWEGTDPDVLLAVYPDSFFPFLPPKWTFVPITPKAKSENMALERKHAKPKPRPDDYFDVMLFVDVYNFEGAKAYSGTGLCFRLGPKRSELRTFYAALRREYVAFRKKWNIQKENEKLWGRGYKPPKF